jgi:hypothetical protein
MARMTHAPEPPFPPAATVSLASIQREYLEDLKCRVSPSHYKNVKARLDRLATALQLGDLHQLQPLQLIRYRNLQREKGASNRTANLVVDSFGAMLAWAVGCGLIPTKPLRQVRPGGREKNGAGGGDRTRDIQLGNWNLAAGESRAGAPRPSVPNGVSTVDRGRNTCRVPTPLRLRNWLLLESTARVGPPHPVFTSVRSATTHNLTKCGFVVNCARQGSNS